MNKILETLLLTGLSAPLAITPHMESSQHVTSTKNHIRALANTVIELDQSESQQTRHNQLLLHDDLYQQEFLRRKMEIFDLASLVYLLQRRALGRLPDADFSTNEREREDLARMEGLTMDFLRSIVLLSPRDFTLAQLSKQHTRLQNLDIALRSFIEDFTTTISIKEQQTFEQHKEHIIHAILPETTSLQTSITPLGSYIEILRGYARGIDDSSRPQREALLRKIEQNTASERDIDEFVTLININRENILSETIQQDGYLPGSQEVLHTYNKLESLHAPECVAASVEENSACLSSIMYNAALQIDHNDKFWFNSTDFTSEYFYVTFMISQAKKYGYLELSKKASVILESAL